MSQPNDCFGSQANSYLQLGPITRSPNFNGAPVELLQIDYQLRPDL